jgi:hypothetical protein
MIETYKLTKDSNQVYDRCIHAQRVFISLVTCFFKKI